MAKRRGKPTQLTKNAQEARKEILRLEFKAKEREDRKLAKFRADAERSFLEMKEEFKLITPERVLARIQRIAINNVHKVSDRLKAEELLGRHLKLFTDKTEHTGRDGQAITFKIDMGGDEKPQIEEPIDVTPTLLRLVPPKRDSNT